jgi:hypothetical protein
MKFVRKLVFQSGTLDKSCSWKNKYRIGEAASQLKIICTSVSSSMVSGGIKSYLLGKEYPVSHLAIRPKSSLLSFSSFVNLFGLIFGEFF